uniref:Enoyl-[acyl-carrier-protein] reductase, mitochondrial n=1 Tax=Brugia malayi TaxID=6279 RepID=A0A0I9R2T9_BRUMA|nr:BMA-MECR-1 [Brugia malayi]
MFRSSMTLMDVRLCQKCCKRSLSSKQLIYEKYGHPPDVLNLVTKEIGKVGADEVRVRWMGAPINPADINQLQGVYPRKPPLPAVGGMEGFGEVEEIGSGVTTLRVGDWVLPGISSAGSWRTLGNHYEKDVFKIAKDLPFDSAATLQVNPPTAYRMLKDFVNLKAGDLVVQNGANSSVGRCVIELCKLWNIRTVNIVRNRENLDVLVRELKEIGADEVFTEEEMKKESMNKAKNAQLALNCVGGRSAMLLSTCLSNKGVMITYGGMSKKPVEVPTGSLIFKDIKLVGFWISQWYTTQGNKKDREAMFEELQDLIKHGKLHPPKINKLKLEEWKTAITNAMNSSGTKQLLIMQ